MSFFPQTTTRTAFRSRKQVRPASTKWVDNSRDEREKAKAERRSKGIGKGDRGIFREFCKEIYYRFFERLEAEYHLPRQCEVCEGTSVCGLLTPAHVYQWKLTRKGEWWKALVVVSAGQECHHRIDSDRTTSEEKLLAIWNDRNRKLGLTNDRIKEMFLEIAEEIQANDDEQKYTSFHVSF